MTPGSAGSTYLGVDVGAVSVSLVELRTDGEVVRAPYALHHGQIEATLRAMLEPVDLRHIGSFGATSSTPALVHADGRYDNQVCLITAARRFHPNAQSILVVGGERFGLIRLDEAGRYLSFRANPLCAAGTGGFLDQQARRLNLASAEAVAALALANRDPLPKIASRCAVFAKTDLVHAQQEGHSLEAICDGLCRGVAKNIMDTLFTGGAIHEPVLVVGGMAKNRAVTGHLRELLDLELVVEDALPMGALGAALRCRNDGAAQRSGGARSVHDFIAPPGARRSYEHDSLKLRLSDDPDFDGVERYLFHGRVVPHSHPLEVDLYLNLPSGAEHSVYLGVDVGSTSTKAVAATRSGEVIAGFYTATAGRPLDAVRLILESVTAWKSEKALNLSFAGVATTGAGRKFIGRIVGADLVLDEITAHARAAVELLPDVDTILEIGGQDSKFTTLKDGRVTLSVMNNVCAAGTGSFIEEQAKRLDVPLTEYGARTEGHRSPLASQRCTVFMERDLNHYGSEGYRTGEILASVLHSVRENYLNNVAVESAIGERVAFQGATARNRALVAAFEQRLRQPIHVSRYCHLAGALGAALTLKDERRRVSAFRGLSLHEEPIPIRSETCELCTNHCKLSIADVHGETVAYGFLCGRDYETKKHVRTNASGFDLLKEHRRAFLPLTRDKPRTTTRVGIPAALHLFEDLPIWRHFFHRLGIPTVTSERYSNAVKDGRLLAGAEFCAPLTALHAHVQHLLDRADVVFLPFYLEKKQPEKLLRRQFCYYTQFAPSLGSGAGGTEGKERILTPLVHSLYSGLITKAALYRTVRSLVLGSVSWFEVSSAYDEALRAHAESRCRLRSVYHRETAESEDLHVVLLGRPYSVLSKWMNKQIPEMFASMGIKVFYQDMLSYSDDDVARLRPLLREVHWHHAANILEAAEVTARTPGAYPVFVTSFKCSPDSFLIDYFRGILEAHGKPYLILELDEHDSRLGYETRVEAAVRAFQNHHRATRTNAVVASSVGEPAEANGGAPSVVLPSALLSHKTILFPNWDSLSLGLVVAALRKRGMDARLLEGSEGSIRRGIRHNSGQCTPLNIIAQDFMEYVERHGLDPARTILWTPASSIACNIRLYPHHIRSILASQGRGFGSSDVYTGTVSLQDISATLPIDVYLAYMFGGFIRRMGCRTRPYERYAGDTDRVITEGMERLVAAFENGCSKEAALAECVARFREIRCVSGDPKPEVAIFGDMYARDNDVMNQDLVHFIEAHGGEVITTPYTSYVKMVVRPYYWKWFLEGKYKSLLSTRALMAAVVPLEKKFFPYFEGVLGEPEPAYDASPQDILAEYRVRVEHTGESMDNLLKIFYTVRHHPDVALFIQASPAFCCPSLITEAMSREIEENTGIPIVSVTYDGSGGNKNDVILPYLQYPRGRGGQAGGLEL
jgi:predicted CoA-substrate-specific enzyme activase